MTFKSVETVIVLCSLGVALAVLMRGWAAVRRTTLLGPWSWAVAAVAAWIGAELVIEFSRATSGSSDSARFAAISLSFCPIVAVLGAKRPQHTAWSFVVLSLWAIVALPAAENFFLHPGQKLSLGDARAWFLWVLIALGPINYVPTKFAAAAVLLAAGQVVALSPYLALIHRPLTDEPSIAGLVLIAGALLAAWNAAQSPVSAATELDRVWLEFRNAFGLFWALRLQERINAVADQSDWGVELTWNGFRRTNAAETSEKIDPALESALRHAFRGLVRRFEA